MALVLRHQDYKRMPWKNGSGVTEEVTAYPPGSDIASFGWRLSIAHVGADDPFSVFAGIDRTIALLDGEGLYLDLPGRTVELSATGEPFVFSGDLEITSRNKSGRTIDLNIMTRRGKFRHEMRRITGSQITLPGDDAVRLLVFNKAAQIVIDGQPLVLERFDSLMLEAADRAIVLAGDANKDVLEIVIYRAG